MKAPYTLDSPAQRQPNGVIAHWYAVVEGTHFSAQEFYRWLLTEVVSRQMPRLRVSRVEYLEGGLASDKRTYLRLARERFAFDVCAAPFGRDYFFSLRLIEKPRGGWLQVFAVVFASVLAYMYIPRAHREYWYAIAGVCGFWLVYRLWIGSQGPAFVADKGGSSFDAGPDFDGFFLNLPGIGQWYERIRKDTYYRYDTRLLFQTLITEIVKRKVEELASTKGLKLSHAYEYSPVLGGQYQARP